MSIEPEPTALRPHLTRCLRRLDLREDAPFIDISSDISLKTRISQLPLTRRTERVLARLGYRCLGDIFSVDLVHLFSTPNVGVKTVREIKALLEAWHHRLTHIEMTTDTCRNMTRSTRGRPSASPRRPRSERLE